MAAGEFTGKQTLKKKTTDDEWRCEGIRVIWATGVRAAVGQEEGHGFDFGNGSFLGVEVFFLLFLVRVVYARFCNLLPHSKNVSVSGDVNDCFSMWPCNEPVTHPKIDSDPELLGLFINFFLCFFSQFNKDR